VDLFQGASAVALRAPEEGGDELQFPLHKAVAVAAMEEEADHRILEDPPVEVLEEAPDPGHASGPLVEARRHGGQDRRTAAEALAPREYACMGVSPGLPARPALPGRPLPCAMKSFALPALLAAAATLLVQAPVSADLWNMTGPIDGVASEPPGFANCTQCHLGAKANTGAGSVRLDGVPAQYVPGQTYTITVTLQDPQASRWGFEVVALDESGLIGLGTVTITDPVNTQKSTLFLSTYVKHTLSGTFAGTSGQASWSYDWTAPPAGSGTARFFVSGNAANNDSTPDGDLIYNYATASAESGAAPDATLVLQPSMPVLFTRGEVTEIHARIRNHTAQVQTYTLISRIFDSSGQMFPASGTLQPPIQVQIQPGLQEDVSLEHFIPTSVPPISGTYEALIGMPPGILVDSDSFAFSILP